FKASIMADCLSANPPYSFKFKVVVCSSEGGGFATANRQYQRTIQKQSDIKTAWKSTGGDQVQGFDHGGLPIGESALQL
ncbi:MAG: hypothetical protein WCP86_11615, partial [bacterium]